MAKKIIENNKHDDDLKLLEEVNNESFNNQFLENTSDISIKGRGKFKSVGIYRIYIILSIIKKLTILYKNNIHILMIQNEIFKILFYLLYF